MHFWEDLDAVILDMDGVLYIGTSLRLGTSGLLARLRQMGIVYCILTNTSSRTTAEIAGSLARMGLHVDDQKIITSSELVAEFVRTRIGVKAAFTLGGENGLAHALRSRNVRPIALEDLSEEEMGRIGGAGDSTTYPLILGYTRHYDYDLATRVLRLERSIGDVYLAGDDRSYAGEAGIMPGIRWVSGSVAALLGKQPINAAKPNPYALEYVLGRLGRPASRTAVIGDSITDVQSGNQAGCRTVLLLGGATPESDLPQLQGSSVPWLVIRELTDLLQTQSE